MSRLPIRVRLTSAFALAMAVVLAATGFFLYVHLESALRRTLDDGLRARADDVAALVRRSGAGLGGGGGLAERGESFAQVLDASGGGRRYDTRTRKAAAALPARGRPRAPEPDLPRAR